MGKMRWRFIELMLLCVYVRVSATLSLEQHVVPGMSLNSLQEGSFREADRINSPDNLRYQGEYNAPLSPEEGERLDYLTKYLTAILLQSWEKGSSPLIYIENDPQEEIQDNYLKNKLDEDYDDGEANMAPPKRSRYYRKYPWKRQNTRETYNPEGRYPCQPTKEDVYRLLVALHGAKQGARGQLINFCNRKRPAHAVFNHIRFLGKRK